MYRKAQPLWDRLMLLSLHSKTKPGSRGTHVGASPSISPEVHINTNAELTLLALQPLATGAKGVLCPMLN